MPRDDAAKIMSTPQETELAEQVSRACDDIVEQYRTGMLTFGAASLGVSKALLAGGLDQPEAKGALTMHIDSLIEVDRDHKAAEARGCSILPAYLTKESQGGLLLEAALGPWGAGPSGEVHPLLWGLGTEEQWKTGGTLEGWRGKTLRSCGCGTLPATRLSTS